MSRNKTPFADDRLRAAHNASSLPFAHIRASETCGCFYCGRVFPTAELNELDDYAWCPHCAIDAILPEREVPEIRNPEFLRAMHAFWF
jgi:DNA-directed RNA polymerase subunit RPC12/RpoP